MSEVIDPSWEILEFDPNSLVYSLYYGKQPKRRGQRSYNLLYNEGQKLWRTLDRDELIPVADFFFHDHLAKVPIEQYMVDVAAFSWKGRVACFLGLSSVQLENLLSCLEERQGWECTALGYLPFNPDGTISANPGHKLLDFDSENGTFRRRLRSSDLGLKKSVGSDFKLGRVYHIADEMEPRDLSRGETAFQLFGKLVSVFDAPGAIKVFSRALEVEDAKGMILDSSKFDPISVAVDFEQAFQHAHS